MNADKKDGNMLTRAWERWKTPWATVTVTALDTAGPSRPTSGCWPTRGSWEGTKWPCSPTAWQRQLHCSRPH